MPIYIEPASEYHGRPAVNASLLWDIVGGEGCLALARWNSEWLNPDFQPLLYEEALENGTIAHLAVLEPEKLDSRISIIDATSWRSKAAQDLREDAYANGLIPILLAREVGARGPSFQKIIEIRKALQASPAAPLLFGEGGQNEVSYTWELDGIPCKARADRIIPGHIIDLKTAPTASPAGFQRSMATWGHHLRASFYMDGWARQGQGEYDADDYLFVVIQKEPPHLVSTYRLEERSLSWGRKLVRRALRKFKDAYQRDQWPGFVTDMAEIGLPVWAEHQLADLEAQEGEL